MATTRMYTPEVSDVVVCGVCPVIDGYASDR